MKDKLVTVASFSYAHRAYLMKGWLDSAGIDCCIINQGVRYSMRTEAQSQIELQVRAEDVERALSIVDKVNKRYDSDPQEPGSSEITIKKILVPVDFSDFSLNAAKYAVNVARQKGAEVLILHAYFNPLINPLSYDNAFMFPSNIVDAIQEVEERAAEKMSDIQRKIEEYVKASGIEGVAIGSRLVSDIAESAILELADKEFFDLIVVGSKGRATSDYWYGSVTAKVIEKAEIPVLVVPEHSVYKEASFKRIMYATNFDKSDGVAITKLLSIARPLDVNIHVVHVDKDVENPFVNYDLNHFVERHAGVLKGVDVKFDLIENRDLVQGIEDYVQKEKIDIISLTTHKRNLLTFVFKPSVARELFFQTKIPLLVFHSSK